MVAGASFTLSARNTMIAGANFTLSALGRLVLFQGSSSNKNFVFLAFSLELLDRFGPDFDRTLREV